MNFALNYSLSAADLFKRGLIQMDRFKCPAWPELVKEAQEAHATYIHFPLKIGWGKGTALDNETGAPVDWNKIEGFLAQTATPLVNLHFAPFVQGEYALPEGLSEAEQAELVAERAIRDITGVVREFGPERVIVENESPSLEKDPFKPVYRPETIRQVVNAAGCGFLFDLSHARLSADMLGMDPREYICRLPVERTREIHVTGVQIFGEEWIERTKQDTDSAGWIARLTGRSMDHLPMTEADWQFFAWAIEQVRQGKWGDPWITTFEYGGIGPFWESVTLPEILAEQVPRLYNMIHEQAIQ